MEHTEIKISQPIFGILVVLKNNELTKKCNEPGKSLSSGELIAIDTILNWNIVGTMIVGI